MEKTEILAGKSVHNLVVDIILNMKLFVDWSKIMELSKKMDISDFHLFCIGINCKDFQKPSYRITKSRLRVVRWGESNLEQL